MAHERGGYISTSGLKSDVTVVFLDPDFLKDAQISAIRVHLRQLYFYLIFAWVFKTSWPKMEVLGGMRLSAQHKTRKPLIRKRCDFLRTLVTMKTPRVIRIW